MALYKVDLQVRLELVTPLHVGTGYGLAGYIDARTLTDPDGYPYIPGSSLKGRLRYYLRRLLPTLGNGPGDPGPLENLFGQENRVGTLFFTDLRLSQPWANLMQRLREGTDRGVPLKGLLTGRHTNVMLSRLRGVAVRQRLFTVETVPPHLDFQGSIHGHLPDQGRTLTIKGQTYPWDLALLVAACQSLTHLGGRKSRGLGRCHLVIEKDGLRVNEGTVNPDDLLEALS
jgi:CRISPR/Cas system CSM-associated protein Csm3 (group 7 of RAMP superfamily)